MAPFRVVRTVALAVTCVATAGIRLPAQGTAAWPGSPVGQQQLARATLRVRVDPRSLYWPAAAVYLRGLQRSYGADLTTVLVPTTTPSEQQLETAHGIAVAAVSEASSTVPPMATLLAADGDVQWQGDLAGGVSHWIAVLLAGKPVDDDHLGDAWALDRLADVEAIDVATMRATADRILASNSRDPRGWVLRLLAASREHDGPLERRIAERGTRELALESLPLRELVDGILRCADGDRSLLEQAMLALVPVLQDADDDVLLQITYLRALLALGRVDEARAVSNAVQAHLPKGSDGWLCLAEALTVGPKASAFAEDAEHALEKAPDRRDDLDEMVHYCVLVRCRHDLDSARDVVTRMLITQRLDLNNLVWDLLTRGENYHRFPELALDLARQMEAQGGLSGAETDTLALALFENGLVREAVAAQEQAAAMVTSPRYQARLQRYRAALERQ